MRLATGLLLSALAIGQASAHDSAGLVSHLPPELLWRKWNVDPLVLAPLLLALGIYAGGLRKLWGAAGSGHGVTWFQALSFALGMAVLCVALVSPLDALGDTLLSAHMAQHGLLVAVAPPLLLVGKSGIVFIWAFASGWRKNFLRSAGWRLLARVADTLSQPLRAAVLHGLTFWVWHAPAVFDAAVARYAVHVVEHLSFFVTALLFWRAILDARSPRRAGAALCVAFATLVHSGLLGALITMAPYPLYAWYSGRTLPWGLSPLEDQQLAGLLMWVPMGVIYLGSCLLLASRLVGGARVRASRPSMTKDLPS
jgi:putative membrane protein